jgi:hypothetical protein
LRWYRPEAARSRPGRSAQSSASWACVRKIYGRRRDEGQKTARGTCLSGPVRAGARRRLHRNLPEAGIAATYGASWDAARAQAEDMLEEAILGMIAHGQDVLRGPHRCRREAACAPQFLWPHRLPPNSKSTGQCAPRVSGRSNSRNDWAGNPRVTRLFGRAARLDHIEAALRALGRRRVVTSEAAEARPLDGGGFGRG